MADQAGFQRAPAPGGIFGQPPQPAIAPMPQNKGLQPADMLPEIAKQDPLFRDGPGALYAVNQHPALAQKYGVIRNGNPIPAQQLQGARPGLSPKTVEGLAAVQAFQQQRAEAESGETAAAAASAAGPAGQAARLANPSGGEDIKPVSEGERRAAEAAVQSMDDFDFNAFREVVMKDLLNNDEQRELVEARLSPLDVTDLIMQGRIVQRVPIIPDKYEPEFQSMTGEEELALKRLLMQERKNIEAPDRYMLDKFQLMTIACALRSVNKIVLPHHISESGDFSDEGFWQKFNRVVKLPFHMLASIGVHYYWFDIRVRKLFIAKQLKNG